MDRLNIKALTALFLLLLPLPVAAQDPASDDFTCSPTKACRIGCCSKSGNCGLGPDFCGQDSCISTCDYKSECDPGWGSQWSNATTCPLNVCCSKFGFCGTISEFCGNSTVEGPSCSGNSASHLTVGYYEGWSMSRACDGMAPEDIPYGAYTHLNYAFAFVDPNSFTVAPMSSSDTELYARLTALKQLNPILKVYISIGGWSMNDPDQPTKATFSDLAGSNMNQVVFSNSLLQFMSNYGFDGVDIDWEYPVAPERSGKPADYQNYVTFLQNLRTALNTVNPNYGLTITIPSSYWYMKNFDIVNIAKVVDWFNLMSYDLHGTWDSTDPYVGAVVYAHTNLTEIEQSLDLLWRNNIDPAKVVLGLGFYGRSFTLSDPLCDTAGCPFSAGGKPGVCTASAGTLSYSEIQGVIASGAVPVLDQTAAVKTITWDTNQWVSYDDQETMQMKLDYINSKCMGGTMVWAATTDNPKGDAASSLNMGQEKAVGYPTIGSAMLAGRCAWTACGGNCIKLVSVITDSGEKGGFLGDLVQLFGKVLSTTVAAAAGLFTLVATENIAATIIYETDGFLLADLGISAGADALTQRCHNDVKQFCCPPQDPPTCHWVGTAPSCGSPSCRSSEFVALQDGSGNGHRCWTGHKSLCCQYDDIAIPEENNACPVVDGWWPISTTSDSDGNPDDFDDYDPGDDDDSCPDVAGTGLLSKRGANETIALTLWERWLVDPNFSHHSHLEKRTGSRTFVVCDRTSNRRAALRSRPYPNVNTLNNQGVQFAQQNSPRSCILGDMATTNARQRGLFYCTEHVMELNFISWSMQGMVDGIGPGGNNLAAGPADFTTAFGPGGLINTPWNQLGFAGRAGAPLDSFYEALGTTANTGNLQILERRLNGLKSVLWRSLPAISNRRWGTMNPTQRIAALNSIVNVFDYLNSQGGTDSLQASYNVILSTWTDLTSAANNQGVTNYDFVGAYREYARFHFNNMATRAADFINNLIPGEIMYWTSQPAVARYGRRTAIANAQNLRNLQNALANRIQVAFAATI